MKDKLLKTYRSEDFLKEKIQAIKTDFGARSIYEHMIFTSLVILICCTVDFYTLKTEWNTICSDDPVFIYGKSLVNAFALDVSLSILAVAQRRKACNMLGTDSFRLIKILSIAVFVTALAFELFLACLTGKYTFAMSSASSTITVEGQVLSSNTIDLSAPAVLGISLINGLTPMLTSVIAYITSYFSTDPIRDELRRLNLQLARAEHAKLTQQRVLAEIGDLNKHFEILAEHEKANYEIHMKELDCLKILREHVCLLSAMKRLDPDSITLLKASAEDLNNKLREADQDISSAGEDLWEVVKAAVTEASNGNENSTAESTTEHDAA